jgi:1-deoxy-D-xylulose-5-phosphate reductoisomerase
MLALAFQALSGGPFLPIVYNAANEAAVELFLTGEIKFLEIPRIVGYVLASNEASGKNLKGESLQSVEAILAADRDARKMAEKFIGSKK